MRDETGRVGSDVVDGHPVEGSPPEFHIPVMVPGVVEGLITDPSGIYVDCTFGEGGHTLELLKRIAGNGGKATGLDIAIEILC